MGPSDLIKTKNLANTRMLIDQFIWQVKTFKILANKLSISLIRHDDDISIICCTCEPETLYFQGLIFKSNVPI